MRPNGGNYAWSAGQFTKTSVATGSTPTFTGATGTITFSPMVHQTMDRWGNVLSVSDPRNSTWVTEFRYNAFNTEIDKRKPIDSVVSDKGVVTSERARERTLTDRVGRSIGTIDANGNVNLYRYDEAGQLVREYRADQAELTYQFDIFGNRTRVRDALGKVTQSTYDRMGRLVSVARPIGTFSYTYDQLGNRLTETNPLGQQVQNFYDTRSRLVRMRLHGGQVREYYYTALGHKHMERDALSAWQVWSTDAFGRITNQWDTVAHTFTYNRLGALTAQTNTRGQNLTYQYYSNGELQQITDAAISTPYGTGAQTWYSFDAAGNRTRERYTQGGVKYKDTYIAYDANNRIVRVDDNRITLRYEYDANGNRRVIRANWTSNAGQAQSIDHWYLYDRMNRITLAQGILENPGQANAGINITTTRGVHVGYDGAGNRVTATFYEGGALVSESYAYDGNNRLTTINRGGLTTSSRSYDAADRVTETISYSSPGVINERRVTAFNTNGWMTQQQVYNAAGTNTATITYTGYDAVGNLTAYNLQAHGSYTNYYSYAYTRFGASYREQTVYGSSTWFQPGQTNTTFDANGNVASV